MKRTVSLFLILTLCLGLLSVPVFAENPPLDMVSLDVDGYTPILGAVPTPISLEEENFVLVRQTLCLTAGDEADTVLRTLEDDAPYAATHGTEQYLLTLVLQAKEAYRFSPEVQVELSLEDFQLRPVTVSPDGSTLTVSAAFSLPEPGSAPQPDPISSLTLDLSALNIGIGRRPGMLTAPQDAPYRYTTQELSLVTDVPGDDPQLEEVTEFQPTKEHQHYALYLVLSPADPQQFCFASPLDLQVIGADVTYEVGNTFPLVCPIQVQFTLSEPESDPKPEDRPVPAVFSDVDATDWFAPYLETAVAIGALKGNGDGTFGPQQSLTRCQMIQALYQLEGEPAVTGASPYTDVGDTWYTKAVQWATDQGITNGVGGGQFAPDQPLTREEMVTFLYRYARQRGAAAPTAPIPDSFSDKDQVCTWAVDAFAWCIQNGVVNGTSHTTLSPGAAGTRAQLAKVIALTYNVISGKG